VHSSWSDGKDDIPAILSYVASQTDLSVVAITDHDCIQGALEARRLAPRYGLEVIVGEEVSTSRGHLLALFIHEHIPPGFSLSETVRWVHEQGGLAVLAHPFDRLANSPLRRFPHPSLADWLSFGLDGLEALNGAQLDPWALVRARSAAAELGLSLTGGSDAHRKEAVGLAYTLFPGRTAVELKVALREGLSLIGGRRWRWGEYWAWAVQSFGAWMGKRGRRCIMPNQEEGNTQGDISCEVTWGVL